MDYFWTYVLGGISLIGLLLFLGTFSRDLFLVKKLKLKKVNLANNFLFLVIAVLSIVLIIYLLLLLKDQISLLS